MERKFYLSLFYLSKINLSLEDMCSKFAGRVLIQMQKPNAHCNTQTEKTFIQRFPIPGSTRLKIFSKRSQLLLTLETI
jgi:hypothetical protein